MILSSAGINIISLSKKENRVITDSEGLKRSLHSLGTCDYLKLEPSNHVLFACQFYEDRKICLSEQYTDGHGETHFEDIYKIRINEITLRELLLVYSIYSCKTQSDIELLVADQPNPTIFFKVFLELDRKSLIPYIAFDSRSMNRLLSDSNSEYFNDEFPVFYKNEDGTSAIDTALDNNQVNSVNLMIDYIVKYQNNYEFANLFENNFVDLLNKGVHMNSLLRSKVFCYRFDFDEWPATSWNTKRQLAPYNNSIFKLRFYYEGTFFKIVEKELDPEFNEKNHRYLKIKYQCNLLSSMSEKEGSIMDAIANSDEIEIFNAETVRDLIDFKWAFYAEKLHLFGATVHFIYVFVLILYINSIYLN